MDWSGVDQPDFVAKTCDWLDQLAERGIKGIKFWKDLGLSVRDGDRRLMRIDDERLAPIFDKAAELRVPVMFHTADPDAFFLPIDGSTSATKSWLRTRTGASAAPSIRRASCWNSGTE